MKTFPQLAILVTMSLVISNCSTNQPDAEISALHETAFERDRNAILAMAGNYHVTFDFRETVSLSDGYNLQDPKMSTGHEIVRILEDTGTFISLQHILVAGGPRPFAIKHWRQDWVYEPEQMFEYTGHNAWKNSSIGAQERQNAWAQLVYQVDDSPRYAGLGTWQHENGISSWTSNPTWRPLPRRDSTTRDDYDVVVATNRHAITPKGWVHEQDNAKLILGDTPHYLAREIGVNTYKKFDDFSIEVGESYIDATRAFWSAVQQEWAQFEQEHDVFGLTLIGEPEPLYEGLLDIAEKIRLDKTDLATATQEARAIIRKHTVTGRTGLALPQLSELADR